MDWLVRFPSYTILCIYGDCCPLLVYFSSFIISDVDAVGQRIHLAPDTALNMNEKQCLQQKFSTQVLLPGFQDFPLTLLVSDGFLLRVSQDERRPRGLGGRAGVCARRTMRGERHTLMVESSLAERSSSWSAGLKATELTTSSCAKRARQML